ncbi:glutathione S-transferase-like [Nymphaea colorata]|nr:glutathione S-transferase-like [Nymphaea colorata]
MGLKVYGMPMSPCTATVLALLAEKGLDYELVPINVRAGQHKQPSFLALNPFGQIPALKDGDLQLFESRAITKYISYKYKDMGPDFMRTDPAEVAGVAAWMEAEAHHYHPAIGPLVFECIFKQMFGGAPDEAVVAAQAEKLGKVLDVYEETLSKRKYLAGDFFSLADLHHLPYTHYLMCTPHASLITSRKHVNAWWEDISSRPAWQKVAANMRFN